MYQVYLRVDKHPDLYYIINITKGNQYAETDYFDVGFYVNMNIGQYDKPYQQIKS